MNLSKPYLYFVMRLYASQRKLTLEKKRKRERKKKRNKEKERETERQRDREKERENFIYDLTSHAHLLDSPFMLLALNCSLRSSRSHLCCCCTYTYVRMLNFLHPTRIRTNICATNPRVMQNFDRKRTIVL